MLLILFIIILATAAGVTAFLLVVAGSVDQFRANLKPQVKILPIITDDGEVVDSKDELDAHMEILKARLVEKRTELQSHKNRCCTAIESISKLDCTSAEVRKYYLKLKSDILKSEMECHDLQTKIEDYKIKQIALKSEVRKDEEMYTYLMDEVSCHGSQDFEIEQNIINYPPDEGNLNEPMRDYSSNGDLFSEEYSGSRHPRQCTCDECRFRSQDADEMYNCRKEQPEKMTAKELKPNMAANTFVYPPPRRSGYVASCPDNINAYIDKIKEPIHHHMVQRNTKKPGKAKQ